MFHKKRTQGKRAKKTLKRRRKNPRRTANKAARKSVSKVPNKKTLVAMLEWFLPDESIFSKIILHGNTKWSPKNLLWLALFWAWSQTENVTDAFEEAVESCEEISTSSPLNTYQGFMNALVRWTSTFMDLLCRILQQRMKEIGGKFWRIDGWVPIAFDGSRSSASRTESNEKAFCAPNYGKGTTAKHRKKKSKGQRRKRNEENKPQPQGPQAWITMMWHMGLRLPWLWRLGPSNSSERAHVVEMLRAGKFPKTTLFCGDAGFVGYPLWSEILKRGGHFLVRVGANVNLLTEHVDYEEQENGLVLCWPKEKMHSNERPLRLRLVKVHLGKTRAWMLTSVLEPEHLTTEQIVKFYKMRWGIEVEFRGLKQTLDRAKLRCRKHDRLLAELNWSILAMAVAELFALKEQLATAQQSSNKDQPSPNPVKRSLAKTMKAIRKCLRHLNKVPKPGKDLQTTLRAAVTDSYQRKSSKRARYCPPNPDKKPLGDPKLRTLTPHEQKQLERIEERAAA